MFTQVTRGAASSDITSPASNRTQEDVLLLVPAGLTGATIVFGFMRNLLLFHVLVRCAQTLHNRMFNSILRTPVHFFDVNPIGERWLHSMNLLFL